MPKGYEKLRDALIRDGIPIKDAKKKAAMIWNSKHSEKVSRKENK